nr:PREDICTED: MAM and LDL-receptor class A domain-containing protein 1-like [Lepisosteus oculatus]
MCLWIAAEMGSAGGLLCLVLCLLWLEEAVSLPLGRTSVSGARARYGFRSRKDWWARFHRKASILNEAVEESPGAALASLKAIDDLHDIHTGFLKSSSRQAVLQDSGLQNSSSSPLPSSSPASHPSSIGHMSDSSSAVAQTTVVPIAAVPTEPAELQHTSRTEALGALVEPTGPATEHYPSSSELHLVEATGGSTEHYASSTEGHGGLVEATGPGTEHYPSSPVAGSTRNQMGWQHAAEQSTSRSPPVQSSSATGPINSADLCDFESDLCNWTQSAADEFDWSLHRERPVSKDPCHSKPGQYLYIQAAFPLQSGQTAVLQSGELSGEVCLSFWYSIFGAGVGSLAVYMQSLTFPSGQHRVWSDSGSESRLWYLEKLDISGVGMEKYRILFVGTIGNSYCGDAALDDVQVQKGVCLPQHRPLHFRRGQRSVPSPTPGTTASSNATSLFCSFEGSLCGWTQCQRDSFDWRLHAPLAPRQGNCIQEREQYLYIMAAFPRAHGQTAVLMSPVLQESVCLSFWYSILGRGVGSLTVYMLYADTPDDWHKLWVGRGSGRRTWAWAEVELYMEPGKTFQILLEGMIQEASCGDAAVDDIRVERRRCSRK